MELAPAIERKNYRLASHFLPRPDGAPEQWKLQSDKISLGYSRRDGLRMTWDGRGRVMDIAPASMPEALHIFSYCRRMRSELAQAGLELVGFDGTSPVVRTEQDGTEWVVADRGSRTLPEAKPYTATSKMLEGDLPNQYMVPLARLGLVHWVDWEKLALAKNLPEPEVL